MTSVMEASSPACWKWPLLATVGWRWMCLPLGLTVRSPGQDLVWAAFPTLWVSPILSLESFLTHSPVCLLQWLNQGAATVFSPVPETPHGP